MTLTPDEFWKTRTDLTLKVFVWSGAAICFLIAIMVFVTLGVLGLLDGALMLGLGWGIALRRSRACAVAAALYYAISQFLTRLIGLGTPDVGTMTVVYIFLALMVLSIYGTFTWQSNYQKYLDSLKLSGALDVHPNDDSRLDD